ncbi:hypothetical protein [Sneathiella chinensis]|uniref:Uncharacterized protein n=1 Tax=Sneathiella chinensis TaxID=349750 RepID=A0ABQ5U0W9_9PROT|nr:hypothetical protein [Sneathiella chinensis]GLQ05805.1 hypothetical protein GCM10007924_10260 [Sneathiella chinensis]
MESRHDYIPEPKLDDVLSDPVILAILKCDGLTVDDVKSVINDYKKRKAMPLN